MTGPNPHISAFNHIPPPLQEAEEFAEQDRAVKARVDARNQLETYAYQMKSTVEDKAKDKVGVLEAQDMLGHLERLCLPLHMNCE
jgi:molecular chaperone DnaK (HSP70)